MHRGSHMQDLLTWRRQCVFSLRTLSGPLRTQRLSGCSLAAGVTSDLPTGTCTPCWVQDGGSECWAPFAVTGWVMFPVCAVAVWNEVEQPQPIFGSRLSLGQKPGTWESLVSPGTTCMPQHVPASQWMEIQVWTIPLPSLVFHWKVTKPTGQRGPELHLTPFPLQSPGTPGHGASHTSSATHSLRIRR